MVKKRSPISLSKYLKIFNLAHGPKKIVVVYHSPFFIYSRSHRYYTMSPSDCRRLWWCPNIRYYITSPTNSRKKMMINLNITIHSSMNNKTKVTYYTIGIANNRNKSVLFYHTKLLLFRLSRGGSTVWRPQAVAQTRSIISGGSSLVPPKVSIYIISGILFTLFSS
jgi:hypothetical protein